MYAIVHLVYQMKKPIFGFWKLQKAELMEEKT